MRDFLPAEVSKRNFVENTIRGIYESYGFLSLETPSIENLSSLLGKYGDEGDQLIFRILHRGEKLTRALAEGKVSQEELSDLGLRYDLTVPLARVVANNRTLPRFFKRFQIQPVWRADRPGKGRYREFMQCDVDITGTCSLTAEAEVCAAVAKVFTTLGINDFTINLNHRQLLREMVAWCGISAELEGTALVAVDKLDKIGEEGVLKELEARGIPNDKASSLIAAMRRPGDSSNSDELARLEGLIQDREKAAEAVSSLRELCELAESTPAAGKIFIDASLARGLGYYTGLIFEIRVAGMLGSLGGGGRYDGLIGIFCGAEIPAVGFSIGFERLILVLEERKLFSGVCHGPELLLCRFDDTSSADFLKTASTLREHGVKVELFPEVSKIGKQIGYAQTTGIPIVGILGTSEVAEGKISIKRLSDAAQQTLDLAAAATQIKTWLSTA